MNRLLCLNQIIVTNCHCRLNNIEKAIKVAGLQDILSGPGPYTFFAPIDEAFAKLPPQELQVGS